MILSQCVLSLLKMKALSLRKMKEQCNPKLCWKRQASMLALYSAQVWGYCSPTLGQEETFPLVLSNAEISAAQIWAALDCHELPRTGLGSSTSAVQEGWHKNLVPAYSQREKFFMVLAMQVPYGTLVTILGWCKSTGPSGCSGLSPKMIRQKNLWPSCRVVEPGWPCIITTKGGQDSQNEGHPKNVGHDKINLNTPHTLLSCG